MALLLPLVVLLRLLRWCLLILQQTSGAGSMIMLMA